MSLAACCWQSANAGAAISANRRNTTVTAVEKVRPSVVNIRGQKMVGSGDAAPGHPDALRRVNGMGTGVIIDPRGYIVTCFHVVDGVTKIQVTLSDGSGYQARMVCRDATTDLAVIKIDAGDRELPVIDIGTSSDLMNGETVIAVGNAFGYENTVTQGVVSALHRSVQVSDTQSYYDLVQTDADINPGNSGGPLVNVDGQMIGINVAVRVGAQGIGFALPVDKVMQITADLLSVKRMDHTWHGVVAAPTSADGGLLVDQVETSSPVAQAGLQPGDVITAVGRSTVQRPLDLERALLGKRVGQEVELAVRRDKKEVKLTFALTSLPKQPITVADRSWTLLGLKLDSVSADEFRRLHSRYRGGLVVTDVREDSPAAQQGIQRGDVLVGMHVWETVSLENVGYVLSREDLSTLEPLKFFILRDGQTLYGHFSLAADTARQTARK
ncbi:MAG: trypsin-like peptidase domain-containing protein [Planctomycetia bacterium]|nr:trypsin-like peptidase domain-containing protein [Planctomycetia bacterium]